MSWHGTTHIQYTTYATTHKLSYYIVPCHNIRVDSRALIVDANFHALNIREVTYC